LPARLARIMHIVSQNPCRTLKGAAVKTTAISCEPDIAAAPHGALISLLLEELIRGKAVGVKQSATEAAYGKPLVLQQGQAP
jgi:hypothetical protein